MIFVLPWWKGHWSLEVTELSLGSDIRGWIIWYSVFLDLSAGNMDLVRVVGCNPISYKVRFAPNEFNLRWTFHCTFTLTQSVANFPSSLVTCPHNLNWAESYWSRLSLKYGNVMITVGICHGKSRPTVISEDLFLQRFLMQISITG